MRDDDLEDIASQNDPHGNDGTRDEKGRGAKRRGRNASPFQKRQPKWKNQLRALKITSKKRAAQHS